MLQKVRKSLLHVLLHDPKINVHKVDKMSERSLEVSLCRGCMGISLSTPKGHYYNSFCGNQYTVLKCMWLMKKGG